jgi:hypothetical protein
MSCKVQYSSQELRMEPNLYSHRICSLKIKIPWKYRFMNIYTNPHAHRLQFLWDFKKLCLDYKRQISTCCNFIHSLYTHIDVYFYFHIMASLLHSTVHFAAKLTGHVAWQMLNQQPATKLWCILKGIYTKNIKTLQEKSL